MGFGFDIWNELEQAASKPYTYYIVAEQPIVQFIFSR